MIEDSLSDSKQDDKKITFAHPIEEQFARILDFYGITWEYEPRTFVLEYDGNHQVKEAFTPDFYLPDQNVYIELTTLRQKLLNLKNRKIKKLKELYPDVHIILLKRTDLRKLMIKFGLEEEAMKIAEQ